MVLEEKNKEEEHLHYSPLKDKDIHDLKFVFYIILWVFMVLENGVGKMLYKIEFL
jgi:hypothetical protein